MRSPTEPSAVHRRYRAFLSYSHQDARWAEWLHLKLESYQVPKRLRDTPGAYGAVPERLFPIFRDREELSSSGSLGARLENALARSEALLVVCSPDAARSRWVNAEVRKFIDSGRSERIYCLIVDGEPNTGDERECFPPALRTGPDMELVAADLRPNKDGRRLALQKLLAGLLGVDLDSLRRRDAQRHHRRMLFAVIASLSGMILALGLATTAWIARNEARRSQEQAQDLIVYMLGDLHKKLEKVGRLDLLGSLSDKAIRSMTQMDSRDLNDSTLKQLAQAMTQLGQVRLGQGQYSAALRLFINAYARMSVLVNRHPHDGDLLFDRGQAEFWVGYVYWKSRTMDLAQQWMTRYRDTSREVHDMDPSRLKWQREVAYGDHNLAAIEFERGQLDRARKGFASARRVLAAVLARSPKDPERIFQLVDETSWLANVQEQQGHLVKAEQGMQVKALALASIVKAHPDTPHWKTLWSDAQLMQAQLLNVLGDWVRARALSAAAVARMKPMIAHDPGNKDWRSTYLHALVEHADASVAGGDMEAARADLATAEPEIQDLNAIASQNRYVRRNILRALQIRTWMALHDRNPRAARKALDALETFGKASGTPTIPEDVGRHGLSEVLAGQAEQMLGRPAKALVHFANARRALEPLASHSSYWRILDPWARLALLTGDAAVAGRTRGILASQDYEPVLPWPAQADPQAAGSPVAKAQHHHDFQQTPRAPARVQGTGPEPKPAGHRIRAMTVTPQRSRS